MSQFLFSLFRYRPMKRLTFWLPAANVSYVIVSAIIFSEHSLEQTAGIPFAVVSLPIAIALSVCGFRMRSIPSDWTVNVLNETTMDRKRYTYEIKDADGDVILAFAKSKPASTPIGALMHAGEDCPRIQEVKKANSIISFQPRIDANKLLPKHALTQMERDVGIDPIEEEEVVAKADNKRKGLNF